MTNLQSIVTNGNVLQQLVRDTNFNKIVDAGEVIEERYGGSITQTLQPGTYYVVNSSYQSAGDRFYTFTLSVPVLPVSEADVFFGTVPIADNDSSVSILEGTDYGTIDQNSAPISRTFTLKNTGNVPLTTDGLTVPNGYTITNTLAASIPAGGSDTFTVRLNTTVAGTFQGNISFTNNDSNEAPYNFAIKGIVKPSGVTTAGVIASDPTATENYAGTGNAGTSGGFTLYRKNSTGSLTLQFKLEGTAVYNTDYTLSIVGATLAYNSATQILSVTFSGTSTIASLVVTAKNDAAIESDETVKLTLQPSGTYVTDAGRSTGTLTIKDRQAI